MATKTSPLYIEDYLQTDEDIKEFLTELANTGSYSDFIHGLATASKAKGMTKIAKEAGVTRASLYKSLSDDGNPRFETVKKIVEALGCKLAIV
jgi:probable addiction module antidote protein